MYMIPGGALGTPPAWILSLVMFVLIGGVLAHLPVATLALFFPLVALVFYFFGGLTVSVGDDGVIVAGIFFPYDRVDFARVGSERPSLRTQKDGAIIRISSSEVNVQVYIPSGRIWILSVDEPMVRDMTAQIEQRLERFRDQPEPPEIPADLNAPAHADAKTQIRALRETLSPMSYRAGSVTTDALWGVAENPRTAPRLRIAATAALASQATEADQTRLRVMTDSMVDDALREQLELAANPARDAELFAALDSEPAQNATKAPK